MAELFRIGVSFHHQSRQLAVCQGSRVQMKMKIALVFGSLLVSPWVLFAQDTPQENSLFDQGSFTVMPKKLPKFQIDIKTMGGRQFWGDVQFFHGYRIQQNVLTKHHRLLDPDDVRRTWGTLKECQSELAKISAKKHLDRMSGKAVILVHGIIRSSKSFAKMKTVLENEGYTVVSFDYPSTRMTMADSADYLARTINSLEGIDQIDLVCHSMGGLLVRAYLQRDKANYDKRIGRLVMVATPNLGAEMANVMQKNLAYQWVFGPAGQELVKDQDGAIAELPTPDFEFGIIAGAKGTNTGWNPLIPGDDDGTVSVASTKLPGAKDFKTIPALHSFMIEDLKTIDASTRFLKTGCFRENGVCVPIKK